MALANPLLLLGGLLVAVPIVLHLIMRRKPRQFEFPALRLVESRHETNQRQLRLRHLLLLALRVAAIGLLALALARPTVRLSGAMGKQKDPVAAVMVFDASPRMDYRHQNRSRLEVAQEMALSILAGLPPESQIAVLDTRRQPGAFQVDRGAAKDRIRRLTTLANSQTLVETLDDAARLLATSELAQREVYVFTDLARPAWPDGSAARLRQRLDDLKAVGLYLIDVGVEEPANTALGELRLSEQVLSSTSSLAIETELFHRGPRAERSVELYLLGPELAPEKRAQATAELEEGRPRAIEFRLGSMEAGTHRGYVEIVGADGLAADDKRFFTVEVTPAWRVLLVAPHPADRYALFLAEALAPAVFRRTGQARFDCRVIAVDRLAAEPLESYGAICLLDPPALDPAAWQRLADFVADGGGLAVFLGRNAQQAASFNHATAQEVLAARLLRQARRPDGDLYLAPDAFDHPLLKSFAGLSGTVPWEAFPVFRYWQLEEPGEGVDVVVRYNDGRPAILERPLGRGRAVTVTTPVSDFPDRTAWNLLPVGDSWPFVILANDMMSYLVGASGRRLNYFAGQPALLQLDPQDDYRAYVLSLLEAPDAVDVRLTPDLKEKLLVITSTDQVGNYRVRAGGSGSGVDRGFSVNLAHEKTNLDRAGEDDLKRVFGEHPYQLARDRDQLQIKVAEGRAGRDLFPILIVMVALLLAAEHVVANRFYRGQ